MTLKNKIKIELILINARHDFEKGLNARAFYKLNNREICGDLVQDTFAKTWKYLINGGQINIMRSFLYHILNNLIIDQYRKKKNISLDSMLEKGFEIKIIENQDLISNIFDGQNAFF